MGKEVIGRVETLPAPSFDSMTKVQRVPVDDNGRDQIEACDPVMLSFGRTLLRKSAEGRGSPIPGQTYPTASVTVMPSAV